MMVELTIAKNQLVGNGAFALHLDRLMWTDPNASCNGGDLFTFTLRCLSS